MTAQLATGEAWLGLGTAIWPTERPAALQDHERRNEPRNEVLLIYEPRRSLGGQVPRNELVTRLGDEASGHRGSLRGSVTRQVATEAAPRLGVGSVTRQVATEAAPRLGVGSVTRQVATKPPPSLGPKPWRRLELPPRLGGRP